MNELNPYRSSSRSGRFQNYVSYNIYECWKEKSVVCGEEIPSNASIAWAAPVFSVKFPLNRAIDKRSRYLPNLSRVAYRDRGEALASWKTPRPTSGKASVQRAYNVPKLMYGICILKNTLHQLK